MSQTILIKLDLIGSNPYQGREDYTEIDSLAHSIGTDGLQEIPKARISPNGKGSKTATYQLNFGHRRVEAFRWLRDNWQALNLPDRYEGYTVMPLDIEELTDEQMYRGAVIENEQREDLNDIEKARMIREYRSTFDKTSAEAGELFGMSDATVRGIEQFLKLPQKAQTMLAEKKITQGTARLLLSAQKLGGEGIVKEALKEIQSNDGSQTPDEIIEHEIDELGNTVEMCNVLRNGEKPRAGHGLWLLDMKNFPNKMLEHLAPGDLVEFGFLTVAQLTKHHTNYLLGLQEGYLAGLNDGDNLEPDLKTKIDHLVNPPACTACPFYMVMNKTHYCGMKACHKRKAAAFRAQKLADLSRTVKIPIYAEVDGAYLVLDSDQASHRKAFDSRHADLRLVPSEMYKGYAWQSFKGLDSDMAKLVAVGESLNRLAVAGSKGKTVGKKSEKEKAEARAMRLYRNVRRELMWGYVVEAEKIFSGVPMEALKKLNDWRYILIDDRIPEEYSHNPGGDKTQYQRRSLVWRLIMEASSFYSRCDLVTQLKSFEGRTTVKPSKELLKRATDWDAQIHDLAKPVAVETPTPVPSLKGKGGKGKKK